jgi:Tol biopolymer transport system component/tRNA A-37 threonylcarbamoyl transferase component Bud32
MPLSPGVRLGPYEIVALLGTGGMGAVYSARDPRLDRLVALKVLHERALQDSESLRRFEQEARAAGALNHPNVLDVHDVGSEDGCPYVISELLEGQTLRAKLEQGPLPVRRALDYAVQIARGLAAAHDKGIVHRDLKPANVFITQDGRVKILDFGLAKLRQGSAAEEQTPSGTILGSVGYMAPEQVHGEAADHRADIFAFGALLFEMLTGQRAFKADTPAVTLALVLTHEVPEIPVGKGGSQSLDRVMRHCLEKEPRARFQSAHDLAFALERLTDTWLPGDPERPSRGGRAARRVPIVAVLLVAALIFGGLVALRRSPPAAPPGSLERLTSDGGLTTDPALSPDGSLIAYASDRAGEGSLDIWVQQTGGGEPLRLTRDPADEEQPTFSPDGRRIAYRSDRGQGGIYVVPALGGVERLLVPNGHWPRFSPDGSRVACVIGPVRNAGHTVGMAAVVPAAGGAPQLFSALPEARMPVWAPDGNHILFAADVRGTYDWWIVSSDPDSAAPPRQMGARAAFEQLGIVTFTTTRGSSDFFPQPFTWIGNRILFSATRGDTTNVWELDVDPRTLTVSGPPRRRTVGTGLESQPNVGPDGRLVFSVQGASVDLWDLPIGASRAHDQRPRPLTHDPAVEGLPSVSDDGRLIAFTSNRLGHSDIWLKDTQSGDDRALTVTPEEDSSPVISRDGGSVIYAAFPRTYHPVVYSIASTGGIPEKICEECGAPTDWSRDRRFIVLQYFSIWFDRSDRAAPFRASLAVRDNSTGQVTEILRHDRFNLYRGHLSPDERWIAFHGDRAGQDTREFIAPFRGREPVDPSEWIEITDGQHPGDAPRWAEDGNGLYYVSDRDGFRCIWVQKLDPATKRPQGPPTAVYHLHARQRSIMGISLGSFDFAVLRDRIVLNMMERDGNIWALRSN